MRYFLQKHLHNFFIFFLTKSVQNIVEKLEILVEFSTEISARFFPMILIRLPAIYGYNKNTNY